MRRPTSPPLRKIGIGLMAFSAVAGTILAAAGLMDGEQTTQLPTRTWIGPFGILVIVSGFVVEPNWFLAIPLAACFALGAFLAIRFRRRPEP